MTEVYEVATFYHHFDVVKEGEAAPPPVTVRVCNSLSCEMAGAAKLAASLQGIPGVRISDVPCVGRCHAAPVAVVGQNPVDHADAGRGSPDAERRRDAARSPRRTSTTRPTAPRAAMRC